MKFKDIYRIKVFFKDKNKKSFFQIVQECTNIIWGKKEIPFYYFKHLYKKGAYNVNDYISTKEAARIQGDPLLHKSELTSIMNNKLAFSKYAEINGIRTAEVYGYHFGSTFFKGKDISKLESIDRVCHYFQMMFNQTKTEGIFIKPLTDFGGKGCFILKSNTFCEQIRDNEIQFLAHNHLFYELVKQHEKINAIHKNCLNTLRVITYITASGNLEFISSYMRFGVDQSPVDNASSGGIAVGIDVNQGTLEETGRKKMEYGGEVYTHHPNSNHKIGGFKIPYFKEVYDLISQAVDFLPDRLIGWDIGISPDGPVIIEANDTPNLHEADIFQAGILKNPVLRDLVDSYK